VYLPNRAIGATAQRKNEKHKDGASSKMLGIAQQEKNFHEESRHTLLHATAILDTGPEDEFDW